MERILIDLIGFTVPDQILTTTPLVLILLIMLTDSNHHSFGPYLVDHVNCLLKDVVHHPIDGCKFMNLSTMLFLSLFLSFSLSLSLSLLSFISSSSFCVCLRVGIHTKILSCSEITFSFSLSVCI